MKRFMYVLCILCLLSAGAVYAEPETRMGGGQELCTGTIFDYSDAKPGHIIVRGYEKTPEWADKPFLRWLVYHHAAMIVKEEGNKKFTTMEAYGYDIDPKEEIRDFEIEKSEWRKTMFRNEQGECIKIKHLRLLEVPKAKKNISEVVQYVIDQDSKRFHLGQYDERTSKDNEDYFYCSKLVWKGYMEGAGIDVDSDGGFYVKPGDLVDDDDTIAIMEYNG